MEQIQSDEEWYADMMLGVRQRTEALMAKYDAAKPPETCAEITQALRTLTMIARLAALIGKPRKKPARPVQAAAVKLPSDEEMGKMLYDHMDRYVSKRWAESVAQAKAEVESQSAQRDDWKDD